MIENEGLKLQINREFFPSFISLQSIENCPVYLFSNLTHYVMYKAYVLLGGNEGDVPAMFRKAVNLIQEAGLLVTTEGSLYKSAAWGEEVDGIFYNKLLVLSVSKEPGELLSILLNIETKLGRKRNPGMVTNRLIDIDILLVDDLVISESKLSIPHPRLHLRRFALVPMCELVPDLVHPVMGLTMQQLLDNTSDQLRVEKVNKNKYPDVSPN